MTSSTSMAKILVRKEKMMWYVHEAIICAKSEYFRKALQGGFKGQQKEVHLGNEDPDAFSLFVDWVYGNDRFHQYTKPTQDIRTRAIRSDVVKEAFLYVRLYHLANYLGVETLENLTMDIIVSYFYYHEHRMRPQPDIVEYVYEYCPSDSLLQTFLIIATAHDVLYSGPSAMVRIRRPSFCVQSSVWTCWIVSTTLTGPESHIPGNESYCSWHTHKRTKKCD
jgi:hypothetical protein